MAGSRGPLLEVTIPASADLSSFQYRAVFINSSGSAGTFAGSSGIGTPVVGVMSNKPAGAGRGARITVQGIEKVECGGTGWAPGDIITAVAGGRGSILSAGGAAAGTAFVIGIAVTSTGASGDLGEVLLQPGVVFGHA